MFGDKIDEIREMMGDPEWASRYFAVKFSFTIRMIDPEELCGLVLRIPTLLLEK